MYERILVPFDGSATAARGLAEAIELGQLTHARLRLIHVVDELSFSLAAGEGLTFSGDLLNMLREGGAAILAEGAASARATGLTVSTVRPEARPARAPPG